MIDLSKDACVSECGRYRTWLARRDPMFAGRWAVFVMLNPSTADAEVDDPTIRRCRGFAARAGCTNFGVVNLFTVRSPDPKALFEADDPVGPEADDALERVFRYLDNEAAATLVGEKPDLVICAWGACPGAAPDWFRTLRRDRIAAVRQRAEDGAWRLHCLGRTADGSPRHPLYVRGDAALEIYREAANG